ncbi:MAG: hypothetical protein Tsb0020_50210 [Haliangiales bacterium]
MRVRTLKVRCPTWRHVEAFYSRKLRKDRTLTLRVPFRPEPGSDMVLGLELPDSMVLNIDGTVVEVTPDEGGGRYGMRLHLHGLDAAKLEYLHRMVDESEVAEAFDGVLVEPEPAAATPGSMGSPPAPAATSAAAALGSKVADAPIVEPAARATRFAPPVSKPVDAPVDERILPPVAPTLDDVSEYEREVFRELDSELTRMRECAAHEVLAVAPDADVVVVRQAYFGLSKRYHPDLFARYRSPAIMYVVQELFIYINKAYDRMRNALVSAGQAIVAGPALIPHDGWLAALDDIEGPAGYDDDYGAGDYGADYRGGADSDGSSASDWSEPVAPTRASEIMDLVGAGQFEEAREHVAAALHFDPRDRRMRALYHVISGRELMQRGEETAAVTQFEAALAHDRDCHEAHQALDDLRARGQRSGVYPRNMR